MSHLGEQDAGGPSSLTGLGDNGAAGSISNISNTSLTSTTNSSSRGNISQSGNQSIGATSSQRNIGGNSSSSSQQNPNFDSNVISERVKNLATQIYQELKKIISRCNYDEDVLSGLMPLIVRVLESLDLALIENQQLQVELELCKDDNDQLVVILEKEKAAKRAIDKKLIESEYAYEEERQQYQQKIESLDSVVKMYELKAKNAYDQAARFEEKEAERKKEYNKLHDRYTELLKSHCDVVERVRHLVGNTTDAATTGNAHNSQQMAATSSEFADLHAHHLGKFKLKSDNEGDLDKATSMVRIREAQSSASKSWNAETELTLEDASLVVIEDVLEANSKATGDGSSHNESDRATSEPEGEHEKESENDSIAYTSMEKEFRKLIQENKDLLNTKNALNVVKDDLIAEVDKFTNEVSMYQQAVEQLNSAKDQMKQKVSSLDTELRKTKQELDKAKQKIRENNEEGIPYSQRKRFGRAEMAKVLMERNNYKERFMELQDALRYSELVRASKSEKEKQSGLWKFFSNLFGAPPREQLAIGSSQQLALVGSRNSSPVVSFHGSQPASDQQLAGGPNSGQAGAGGAGSGQDPLRAGSIRSINQRLSTNSDLIVLMDSDLNVDRGRTIRDADQSGYIHAYGWSLPASSVKMLSGTVTNSSSLESSPVSTIRGGTSSAVLGGVEMNAHSSSAGATAGSDEGIGFGKLSSLQVPIPQYCRPLTGDSLGMKIWCATAIDMSGGDSNMGPTSSVGITRVPSTGEPVAVPTTAAQQASSAASLSLAASPARRGTTDMDSSGSVVNISSSTPIKSPNQQALSMLEQEVYRALQHGDDEISLDQAEGAPGRTPIRRPILKTSSDLVLSALPIVDHQAEELSACVWICSTQHSRSKITIIDIKTKPNELLDSFYVPTFLYCIKSISGCKYGDTLGIPSPAGKLATTSQQQGAAEPAKPGRATLTMIEELIATQRQHFYRLVQVDKEAETRLRMARLDARNSATPSRAESTLAGSGETSLGQEASEAQATAAKLVEGPDEDSEISRILDNNASAGIATLQKLNDFVAHMQPPELATGSDSDSRSAKTSNTSCNDQTDEMGSANMSRPADTTGQELEKCRDVVYYQPISTCLPTVWMGGKDSVLYVHSAIGQWKDCLACVKLADSILQICSYRGKVFVALADGTMCVFFRNSDTKQWEFGHYLVVDVNLLSEATNDIVDLTETSLVEIQSRVSSQSTVSSSVGAANHTGAATSAATAAAAAASEAQSQDIHDEASQQMRDMSLREQTAAVEAAAGHLDGSPLATPARTRPTKRSKVAGIRCLEIANKNLWIGYKNRVLILDPINMKLKHTFNVVPQVDNQIRQLVSMKDGVFCCLRSDLTLRLYSSLKPYQHIQNIDIEPIVTRLISPKTFVISHITAMKVADNTLWIGNAHGIILAIPCKLVPQVSETPARLGAQVDLDDCPSSLSIARFVPKCDIANAQISFHGHKDAVKFFILTHNLMLSGGQGYLDFRLDMDDQSKSMSDKSHLILWQLPH